MDKKELLQLLRFEGVPENILEAFAVIQREDFIPEHLREYAYENHPLPIGHGQTISQPSTIAFMLEELDLRDNMKILEIGSGCGYVLALISEIVNCEIFGVERIKELAEISRKNLNKLPGRNNIKIIYANGYRFKDSSPFDRILVSAAASEIPKEIIEQLSDGGIAIIPVKNSIFKVARRGSSFYTTEYYGFAFVELVK